MIKDNLIQEKHNREINWSLIGFSILVGLIYLFFTKDVYAAVDYSSTSEAHSSFSVFIKTVGSHITAMQTKGHIVAWFVNAQFLTFATYRLTVVVGRYVFDRADIVDVFSVIILIAIVQILISFYSVLLSGLFSWSNDIAGAIQKQIIGSDNTWFAVDFMSAMFDKITIVDSTSEVPTAPPSQAAPTGLLATGWNSVVGMVSSAVDTVASIGFNITSTLTVLVMTLMMWILNLIIFIGIAWAVWGFAIAKLIGLFFIPFLLIEKLAPLFDGWLKFLIGFLVYGIIIKVNASLIMIMLSTYFEINSLQLPLIAQPIYISAETLASSNGLSALVIVSILAVLSTGGFATAIAGGVGGFGSGLATAARTTAIALA